MNLAGEKKSHELPLVKYYQKFALLEVASNER